MHWAKLSVLAVGAALWPAASYAVPAGAGAVTTAHGQSHQSAEKVACWWRNGVRHCDARRVYRRYGYRSYGYGSYPGYGRPRPEDFPTGSTQWWRAMDLDDRGGFRR